jgi:putative metallohydrolase (TIGR04338 family)
MIPRDSQRQRLYNAQHALTTMIDLTQESDNPMVSIDGVSLVLPPEAKFASLDSIQIYIKQVLAMPSVIERFGHNDPDVITVRERKGHTAAHYEGYGPHGGIIAVHTGDKNWAMREVVILHEIAHHFTRNNHPAHGPKFATALVDLLGLVMGPQAAMALRLLFVQSDVATRVAR